MHELKWEGCTLHCPNVLTMGIPLFLEIPSKTKNDKIKNAKIQGTDIAIYMDSGDVYMLFDYQDTNIMRLEKAYTRPLTIEVKYVNRLMDKEG